MNPTLRLALTATLAAYTAGLAIGTGIAWAAWTLTTHEHRYRIR